MTTNDYRPNRPGLSKAVEVLNQVAEDEAAMGNDEAVKKIREAVSSIEELLATP